MQKEGYFPAVPRGRVDRPRGGSDVAPARVILNTIYV